MEGMIGILDPMVQAVVKGRFTTQQVLVTLVVIVAVFVGFKLLKGILKTACLIGGVVLVVIYFGLASPTQIKNLALDTVGNAYEKYQTISHSIEREGGEIYINVGEQRIALSQIESYKKALDGRLQLLTAEGTYTVEDERLKDFFDEITRRASEQ